MIVLARRRKAQAEDAKPAKMQRQKPRAKCVAKTKVKAVKVKTECVEEQMQKGTVLCSAYTSSSFVLTPHSTFGAVEAWR